MKNRFLMFALIFCCTSSLYSYKYTFDNKTDATVDFKIPLSPCVQHSVDGHVKPHSKITVEPSFWNRGCYLGEEGFIELKINGKEEPIIVNYDARMEVAYYFPKKGIMWAQDVSYFYIKKLDKARNYTYILEKINPVHRQTASFKDTFNYQLTINMTAMQKWMHEKLNV